MKKHILRKLLIIGLAVTGVGQSIQAMAVTTNIGGGVGATGHATVESKPSSSSSSSTSSSISGMKLVFAKGTRVGSDPNREDYQEAKDEGTNILKSRYTHKDGTPYTGLYLELYQNGTPDNWIVLDKDGFLTRDSSKRQHAWDNGRETSDFMIQAGPNKSPEDSNYYLGEQTSKDGAPIVYIAMNKWIQDGAGIGSVWYRSNEKGICYRNQWFKDTDGKWYYFDDNCKMVTNQYIGSYWIGSDGVWQG